MRYFPLFDFQMVVLLSFFGLTILLLLYIALGKFVASTGKKKGEEDKEEYPGGIQTTRKPFPLILVLIYLGFILWAISYVVVIGIRGGPF
jgi:hypothetical protein